MFVVIYPIISLIAGTIHLLVSRKPRTAARVIEVYLLYFLVVNVGVQGIVAAYADLFMANEIARQIGWPTGSPFQFEVGMANLAIGVTAIVAIWLRQTYWIAVVLNNTVFLLGAAYGHLIQIQRGNTSPLNSGVFLYVGDILMPIVIFLLMVAYCVTTIRASGGGGLPARRNGH